MAFLNDGSLERGESPDPDKILSVLIQVKIIKVKVTKNQTVVPDAVNTEESVSKKSADGNRTPATSKRDVPTPVDKEVATGTVNFNLPDEPRELHLVKSDQDSQSKTRPASLPQLLPRQ